jgi:uncharacterized protein DUF3891
VIIRRDGEYFLLITQPDHAALAEQIISRWRRDGFPAAARRETILFATRHHDDGWLPVDAAPMVDETGREPLDYIHASEHVRRSIWPRGVASLADTPYAAALVAQHAIHIYDRYRDDPAWRDFFAEMETLRTEHLRLALRAQGEVSPLTLDDLIADYFFVRMADLLSLAFCDGWHEPQRQGPYEVRWDGARLTVDPDPFDGAAIPLAISARVLPVTAISNGPESAARFRQAPQIIVTGTACGLRRS